MSYESNDERIDRLEQKFAELLSIKKDALRLNVASWSGDIGHRFLLCRL